MSWCRLRTATGEAVCGVTSLAGEIYLLRRKERDQVEVYDSTAYRLQRSLTVPNARAFTDMTSCEHYYSVYIGDDIVECVHRLNVQGAVTRWTVHDKPQSMSVNAAHNVLVTCPVVRKLKEFSSNGNLLREVALPSEVVNPRHAIQTHSGQFIVCHGGLGKAVHRVCMISADGRHIVHSHGGQPGSDTGQYNGPVHLAVDDNESVFVADRDNRRVTLLSPTLENANLVVSGDQLNGEPLSLYLDIQHRRRRIYVTVSESMVDGSETGRVVVFNV